MPDSLVSLYLVDVEHQVQLTNVLKVVVQDFHEQVDGLDQGQLVVRHVDAHGEEEACISAVDDLVGTVLQVDGKEGMGGVRDQTRVQED